MTWKYFLSWCLAQPWRVSKYFPDGEAAGDGNSGGKGVVGHFIKEEHQVESLSFPEASPSCRKVSSAELMTSYGWVAEYVMRKIGRG